VKEIPYPLQSWATPLGMLTPEVQSGLGAWLAPLRALFGPLAPPRSAAQGDPDGYDGIAQRGPYERLLLSEWALALELPDEFLRRAVMGEHAFARPAFREPRGSGCSIALLDAGPDQLGTPRLAHLAALIVLEARATAQGAAFLFRPLQQPGQLDVFDERSLRGWARGPTWAPPQSFAKQWTQVLADHRDAEVWVIGAPSLRTIATELDANLLAVAPQHKALFVTAHTPGRTAATATLPLPPSDVGVRVLRAPLRNKRAAPTRIAPANQLGTLAADGRHLFLPVDGGFVGYAIPQSTMIAPGKAKKVSAGVAPVLLGVDQRKHIVGLGRDNTNSLALLGSGLLGKRSVGEEVVLPFRTPPALRSAAAARFLLRTKSRHRFEGWIVDPRDQLWRLEVEVDDQGRFTDSSNLTCLDRSAKHVTRVSDQHIAWQSRSRGMVLTTTTRHQLDGADPEATFVAARTTRDDSAPLYGAWLDGVDYIVMPPPPASPITIPAPDGTVFGLSVQCKNNGRPRLLFTRNDREVWSRQSDGAPHRHFTTQDPLVEVHHEPAFECVVWRTTSALGVYSIARDEMARRLTLRGGRP